ncbi:O-antigen ligase family protein [Cerasicoccus fimbriatus]|uniref:O-antigen ligase family protein n=1 Tax=Cerasicoccus fimbriatus TaxID=3014554 RepID=UPI0022B3F110|nr:O-antigen ligase family protein [Cerasicoccus sp. TK19100]
MAGALTVEEFRKGGHLRRSSRSRVSRDEWVILGVAAPAVIISPFLLGGMVWWSQVSIACMQALIFLVALTPFSGIAAWRQRLLKLVKLPPFWLGGLFVIYVLIQALNPSMKQVYVDETRYYIADLKPEYYIDWLPQSILTNFYTMNAWRMVIFWAGAWAFVCGLWMGLNNRKAWLALGWMALGTGAVLSLASIAHHLSSNEHLFWLEQFKRNEGAFGPFVYRNQAAAYLYLSMGLGFVLFLYLLRSGKFRSGLPMLAIAFSLICLLGVALCPSRGGWLGASGVFVLFIVLLPFSFRFENDLSVGSLVGIVVIAIAMVCGSIWVARAMDFSQIGSKWKSLRSGDEVSLEARFMLSKLTLDMHEDRPWVGWGAGSFSYRYRYYGLAYPDLYFIGDPLKSYYGNPRYISDYKQSHNDVFQFLAEYGIVGCSFMLLNLGYFIVYVLYKSFSPEWVLALCVCVLFILHNLGDFLLQNSILQMSFLILILLSLAFARRGHFTSVES